jgi:hypothetical protein
MSRWLGSNVKVDAPVPRPLEVNHVFSKIPADFGRSVV